MTKIRTFFHFVSQLAIVFLVCANCTTISKYDGRKPNLELNGEEAEKEITDFSMERYSNIPYFSFNHMKFHSVKIADKYYLLEDVQSLMNEISPAAHGKFLEAKKWAEVEKYLHIALLGSLAWQLADGKDNDAPLISIITLGVIYQGVTLVTLGKVNSAVDMYNQDLRRKYTPGIGYNFRF